MSLDTEISIEAAAGGALDRRLERGVSAPLAVAVSGGGDSLALLHIAAGWAARSGRSLLVLHVDHALNPQSVRWAADVAKAAARTGADCRLLTWAGEKPVTGLPAAARAARHGLLAEAARGAGAKVILMAHTADDLAEARLMRRSGSSVGEPRDWTPSPAWPQGRGIFLLRPLLTVRREALRDLLRAAGQTWLDDPANDDPRYARGRARLSLAGGMSDGHGPQPSAPSGQPFAWRDLAGGLIAPRDSLLHAPAAQIAAACLCAAGTARPPRSGELARLRERIGGTETFAATLAGARIQADDENVLFLREAGEAARGGLAPMTLPHGQTAVWDGRFELVARAPGLSVRALAGHASALPDGEQSRLRALPAAARRALPLVTDAAGGATCPILAEGGPVHARALALGRLQAFCGLVENEAEIGALN